jgi:hypothetical protein
VNLSVFLDELKFKSKVKGGIAHLSREKTLETLHILHKHVDGPDVKILKALHLSHPNKKLLLLFFFLYFLINMFGQPRYKVEKTTLHPDRPHTIVRVHPSSIPYIMNGQMDVCGFCFATLFGVFCILVF